MVKKTVKRLNDQGSAYQVKKMVNSQEKVILVKKMVKCLGKTYSSQENG